MTHPHTKPARRIHTPLGFGFSVLLVALAMGCDSKSSKLTGSYKNRVAISHDSRWTPENQLVFQYQVRDGRPVLESERVVLVFHGLSPVQQRLFHFQEAQQAVQIAGPGMSEVTTTSANAKESIRFNSRYEYGTNTLQFGKQSVQLTQGGQLLLAGNQSVDLSGNRKTIHLRGSKVQVE